MEWIYTVIFILIALFELPALLQKKLIREMIAFLILLAVGITVSILLSIGIKVPSPIGLIKIFIDDVLKISYI